MSKYSYQELQSMTREDFIEEFEQPLKMHRENGIKVNGSEVVRQVIRASLELKWIKRRERALKEFWYQVKSFIIEALGNRGLFRLLFLLFLLSLSSPSFVHNCLFEFGG